MQIRNAPHRIEASLAGLYQLAAGEIAKLTSYPFITAPNKFETLGSLDSMVPAHAALRGLAAPLIKVANDMRWLASIHDVASAS